MVEVPSRSSLVNVSAVALLGRTTQTDEVHRATLAGSGGHAVMMLYATMTCSSMVRVLVGGQ